MHLWCCCIPTAPQSSSGAAVVCNPCLWHAWARHSLSTQLLAKPVVVAGPPQAGLCCAEKLVVTSDCAAAACVPVSAHKCRIRFNLSTPANTNMSSPCLAGRFRALCAAAAMSHLTPLAPMRMGTRSVTLVSTTVNKCWSGARIQAYSCKHDCRST